MCKEVKERIDHDVSKFKKVLLAALNPCPATVLAAAQDHHQMQVPLGILVQFGHCAFEPQAMMKQNKLKLEFVVAHRSTAICYQN